MQGLLSNMRRLCKEEKLELPDHVWQFAAGIDGLIDEMLIRTHNPEAIHFFPELDDRIQAAYEQKEFSVAKQGRTGEKANKKLADRGIFCVVFH